MARRAFLVSIMSEMLDVLSKCGILGLFGLVYRKNARKVHLSEMYETYDWVNDDEYNNLATWIEKAAKAVGR